MGGTSTKTARRRLKHKRPPTRRARSAISAARADANALRRAHEITEAFSGDPAVTVGGDELIVREKDLERMEAIRLVVAAVRTLDTSRIQFVAATLINQYGLLDRE